MLNLASIHWCWIKSQRQSFGWSRKKNCFALQGKEWSQWANVSKPCVPTWGLVRSFIVMVQRRCNQHVDILLIGWWWGNRGSTSSTFWLQPIWGLLACGQHTVNFLHLLEVSVPAEQLRDIFMCIPWVGTRTRSQNCTIVSWLFPCLCIPSLPWLATVWTCPLELREGHGGWNLFPTNKKLGTQQRKALVPGSPTWSYLASLRRINVLLFAKDLKRCWTPLKCTVFS